MNSIIYFCYSNLLFFLPYYHFSFLFPLPSSSLLHTCTHFSFSIPSLLQFYSALDTLIISVNFINTSSSPPVSPSHLYCTTCPSHLPSTHLPPLKPRPSSCGSLLYCSSYYYCQQCLCIGGGSLVIFSSPGCCVVLSYVFVSSIRNSPCVLLLLCSCGAISVPLCLAFWSL